MNAEHKHETRQESVLDRVHALQRQLAERIIGQETLINRLLLALLADGHLLVEGAPGLAKTRAVKVLADNIDGHFHRIQFTPDLLPADLTGVEIFRQEKGSFEFQPGPLFHNLLLADEINRAPAKVQSALLEAMAERQITIGRKTRALPKLFLVMATQNPIDQEGTYSLPEAQLDRFLLQVNIGYPAAQEEQRILRLSREEAQRAGAGPQTAAPLEQEIIFRAREEVLALYMADNVEQYILQLVLSTRAPEKYGKELAGWLQYGGSPRATIALDRCARAHAWLRGRDYVDPEDVQAVAHDVLRHRLILHFEAEAEGVDSQRVVSEFLERVAVP